jgi:hypothetical protein
VRILPRSIVIIPVRARPSFVAMEKEKLTGGRLVLGLWSC